MLTPSSPTLLALRPCVSLLRRDTGCVSWLVLASDLKERLASQPVQVATEEQTAVVHADDFGTKLSNFMHSLQEFVW